MLPALLDLLPVFALVVALCGIGIGLVHAVTIARGSRPYDATDAHREMRERARTISGVRPVHGGTESRRAS